MSLLDAENAISIVRGTSKTLQLCVKDMAGAAVNLTGARVILTVKCRITDRDPLIQKDSAVGPLEALITIPLEGKAEFYLSPVDTQTLEGKFVFDVWVILSSGKRYLVVGPGDFTVLPGVTVLSP